jgi:hypothetical protein
LAVLAPLEPSIYGNLSLFTIVFFLKKPWINWQKDYSFKTRKNRLSQGQTFKGIEKQGPEHPKKKKMGNPTHIGLWTFPA